MSKQLTILLLALAAVATGVYWLTSRQSRNAAAGTDSERRRAEQPSADAKSDGDVPSVAVVAAATAVPVERRAVENSTTIKSSLGLVPDYAYAKDGTLINRVPLGQGGEVPEMLPRPVTMFIPGHQSVVVDEAAAYELEPEYGLVVKFGAGLRCIRSVTLCQTDITEVTERPFYGDDVACAWIDETQGRLNVCVDPARYFMASDAVCSLRIELAGGVMMNLELKLEATGTHYSSPDIPQMILGSNTFEAVCCEATCRSPIECQVWPAWGMGAGKHFPEAHDWGIARIYRQAPVREFLGNGPVVVDAMVLGQEYGVSGICRKHAAYGRGFVVASPDAKHSLDLVRGGTVSGQSGLESTNLLVQVAFGDDSVKFQRWYEEFTVRTQSDGSFSFAVPHEVERNEQIIYPMPNIGKVSIKPVGCDKLTRDIDLSLGLDVDLGYLGFECNVGVICVRPDVLHVEQEFFYVRYRGDSGLVERAVDSQLARGEVVLVRLVADSEDGSGVAIPQNVIINAGEYSLAYHEIKGCYDVVPYEQIVVEPQAQVLRDYKFLGWTWEGIPDASLRTAECNARLPELILFVPRDVEGLWMGESRFGQSDATPYRFLPLAGPPWGNAIVVR